MRKLGFVLTLFLACMVSNALAAEHVTGKVTVVEATYMPSTITFMLDNGTSMCPAGTWLTWSKSADNNKAVYAALMTAISTGKKVSFYHEATSCSGVFLHVIG